MNLQILWQKVTFLTQIIKKYPTSNVQDHPIPHNYMILSIVPYAQILAEQSNVPNIFLNNQVNSEFK